ncbi:hypothetical protein D3C78_1425360 [compost metagenome]
MLGGGIDVLRSPDDRDDVAAKQLGLGQHGNGRFGRAAPNAFQEHAAGARPLGQLFERLAVHFLVRDVDVHTLGLDVQKFGIFDFAAAGAKPLDQLIAFATDGDDIARFNHRGQIHLDDGATPAYPFHESAIARLRACLDVANRHADEGAFGSD